MEKYANKLSIENISKPANVHVSFRIYVSTAVSGSTKVMIGLQMEANTTTKYDLERSVLTA